MAVTYEAPEVSKRVALGVAHAKPERAVTSDVHKEHMRVERKEAPTVKERVAIVGSRAHRDLDSVAHYVINNLTPAAHIVVSGGAQGVDMAAQVTAEAMGIETHIYPADWEQHGKRAGFIRNLQIVNDCDRVVAFWDGTSRGTKHTIDLARARGIPVDVRVHSLRSWD